VVEGKAIDFDPEEGTVTRANVRCPICRGAIDDGTTRRLFREGKAGERMVAVVLHHPDRPGKRYRLPTARDLEAYRAAEEALEEKRRKLWEEWGMDPVPDEPLPPLETSASGCSVMASPAGATCSTRARSWPSSPSPLPCASAHKEMLAQGTEPEFAQAVATYLALGDKT
jgi:putative DNA methylase